MSSPSSLSDSVNLNKFNALFKPPEIPEPPPIASMFDQASVVKWINNIPKDGDVRNTALKVFLNGVEREGPYSQYDNSRGDYGAIMLELDYIQKFMSTSRKDVVESSKHVFSFDLLGRLVTNSFEFNRAVSNVGVAIHIQSLMIKFRDELVNPGPSPNPTPRPTPNPDSAAQAARDWFEKNRQMGEAWFERIFSDAKSELTKYQLFNPPSAESQYLVLYYRTLVELCEDQIKGIQSERWWSDFWVKYKWWIVGGVVSVVTIYAIWKTM